MKGTAKRNVELIRNLKGEPDRGTDYLFPIEDQSAHVRMSSDQKRMVVTINSMALDTWGTIIEPKGVVLDRYEKNPIVLLQHYYPAATNSKITLRGKGKNQTLQATVDDEDWDLEDGFVQSWYRKIKRRIIRMSSIGFRPLEWVEEKNEDDGFFYRITKWLLLEWSFVVIGANPDALIQQRAEGLKLAVLVPELSARLLKIEEGLDNLKAPFGNKKIDEYVKDLVKKETDPTLKASIEATLNGDDLVNSVNPLPSTEERDLSIEREAATIAPSLSSVRDLPPSFLDELTEALRGRLETVLGRKSEAPTATEEVPKEGDSQSPKAADKELAAQTSETRQEADDVGSPQEGSPEEDASEDSPEEPGTGDEEESGDLVEAALASPQEATTSLRGETRPITLADVLALKEQVEASRREQEEQIAEKLLGKLLGKR